MRPSLTWTGAVILAVFALLSLTGVAHAATYKSQFRDFSPNRGRYTNWVSAGTHTFIVDGILQHSWGELYINGTYIPPSQESKLSNGYRDPTFNGVTINSSTTIEVIVYNADNLSIYETHVWRVDTTAPATPGTPNLSSSDDSGRSNSDNITNRTSGLTFSWSASSDSGTGLDGYEWRLDSGSWSFVSGTSTSISASAGSHTFYVRAIDNASPPNRSSSRSLAFTVDTTSPNVPSIIYPSVNQRITDTTPNFDWSGGDNSGGSGIWRYRILVETDTLGLNKIDEYTTSSSYNTPSSQRLDAGGAGYDWEVWADDVAGNRSSGTGENRFYIDDQPDLERPTTPGTPDLRSSSDSGRSDTDDITNDSTPTFDWSASSDNRGVTGYEYRVDSGSWTDNGNNRSVTLPSQAQGQHAVQVRAYDAAGNQSFSSSSLTFRVDTIAPNVPSIIYPSVNQRISDTTPNFDWSGGDNSGGSGIWRYRILVETDTLGLNKIDEYTTSSSYNTPSSQRLDAGGAGYDWEVWADDVAGNRSSGTGEKRFYIDDPPDLEAPTSPGTPDLRSGSDSGFSSTDNLTNDSTPTFDWAPASDNRGVTGYEYRVDSDSWTDNGNSRSVTLPLQSEGQHTLQVRAYDAAGNQSASVASLVFTIDTVAPPIPTLQSPTDGATESTKQPLLNWTSVAGARDYRLAVTDREFIGAGDRDLWLFGSEYQYSEDMQDDDWFWMVKARDAAGNESGWSVEWTFTVDTEPAIISAYWWMPLDVSAGDATTMAAEVHNIPPGTECTFKVSEDDFVSDDQLDPPYPTGAVYVAEGDKTYVRAVWLAEWQNDGGILPGFGDPEYFFEVVCGGVSKKSSRNEDEEVKVRVGRQEPSARSGDFSYSDGEATDQTPLTDDRIPVVLVHGLNGDNKVDSLNYWYGWVDDNTGRFNQPDMRSLFRVYRYVYDSRRHIADNGTELAHFILGVMEESIFQERQLIVMAHSMGGLVARYALNTNPLFRDRVHRLITLGTPHLGSPGANPTWILFSEFGGEPMPRLSPFIAFLYELGNLHRGTEGYFDLAWHDPGEIPVAARSEPALFAYHQLYDDRLLDESLSSPFTGSHEMQSQTAADEKLIAYGGYSTISIDGMGDDWPETVAEEVASDHRNLAIANLLIALMQKQDESFVGLNDGLVPVESALLGSTHLGAEKLDLTNQFGEQVDHASYLDVAATMDYVADRLRTILRVTISPTSAIAEGARWRIAGGQWQKSGVGLGAMAPGQYTIEFKALAGWNEPSPQSVSVDANQETVVGGFNTTYSLIPTPTPTATDTSTPSSTPTETPTPTWTATWTPSNTPTPTLTSTNTPTWTPTRTPSHTPTVTPTNSPSVTPSHTATETPTITPTETPSATPTDTPDSTPPTDTPTQTPTATLTETPTQTPTNTPGTTPPTPTETPSAAASPTPTPTAPATATPTATDTPFETPSPSPTPGPFSCAAFDGLCVGDCDGDGATRVHELVLGINIALGNLLIDQCGAFDVDSDGRIVVSELVRGIGTALCGCDPM